MGTLERPLLLHLHRMRTSRVQPERVVLPVVKPSQRGKIVPVTISPEEAYRRQWISACATAFIVMCLLVEFGTFSGLVAEINQHFYGVVDPTSPNGTWPIISFGLAMSGDIQAFYVVITSMALFGNILWFVFFDTLAKHTDEHMWFCCGSSRVLWVTRASSQLLQMVFLIALGSISVIEAHVSHNLMGVFAAFFFLVYEGLSIPYRADRLITLSKSRMADPMIRCVPEIMVITEAFLVCFFLVAMTCFWTVDCSGVAESSWWEYVMYLVFPLTRGFRVVDIMIWKWGKSPLSTSTSPFLSG